MSFDPQHELTRFRRTLVELERQADVVRALIGTLEGQVTANGKVDVAASTASGKTRVVAEAKTSAKRVGVKERLRELTKAPGRYNVDAVIAAYREAFGADDLPARVTFTNRLGELVADGHLRKIKRGLYERLEDSTPRLPARLGSGEEQGPQELVPPGDPPVTLGGRS